MFWFFYVYECRQSFLSFILGFFVAVFFVFFYSSCFLFVLVYPLFFQCVPFFNSSFSEIFSGFEMAYVDLTEMFFIEVRLTFIFSILVCIPFFWLQFLFFVWDSLYFKEKFVLAFTVLGSCFSMLITCFICTMLFIPNVWEFFNMFNNGLSGGVLVFSFFPVVGPYVSLCLYFLLFCLLFFQLPVFFMLAVYCELFEVRQLVFSRKLVYFMLFVLASFISPPDIMSQIFLGIPSFCFFEFFIIFLLFSNVSSFLLLDD